MGSIFRIDHQGHEESVVNLVIGTQEIRESKITPVYDFVAAGSINSLVHTIHFGREHLDSGFSDMVYYRNCYDHAISCMNDSIINLIGYYNTKLYVTNCGGILLYGKHDFYSTVDMQSLDFHEDFGYIFREYEIADIFESSNHDYITFQNIKTRESHTFELVSTIDLSGDCAVKIAFKDALI